MTTVRTQDNADEDPGGLRAARQQLADEADQAVESIKEKIKGMQAALKAKQAEAKQLRADVDRGEG